MRKQELRLRQTSGHRRTNAKARIKMKKRSRTKRGRRKRKRRRRRRTRITRTRRTRSGRRRGRGRSGRSSKRRKSSQGGFLWSFLPPLLPSLRVFPQLLAARLQLGLALLGQSRLGAATRGHPVEDGLRNRSLKVAREPGPSPTRVNAQLAVLLACGEPKQLAKERQALLADGPVVSSTVAQNKWSVPEALVVLVMLPQTASRQGFPDQGSVSRKNW